MRRDATSQRETTDESSVLKPVPPSHAFSLTAATFTYYCYVQCISEGLQIHTTCIRIGPLPRVRACAAKRQCGHAQDAPSGLGVAC